MARIALQGDRFVDSCARARATRALAVSNPLEAFGFLYVIPISMLAVELGVRGGLLAATGALLLTVFWAVVQDVSLGIIGYSTRVGLWAANPVS